MTARTMTTAAVCEVNYINQDRVRRVERTLPSDAQSLEVARIFEALADPTRLKILFALSREELCVCDVAYLLGMSLSAVSHQLRTLRNLRLVTPRREGRIVYYSMSDRHVAKLLDLGIKHERE